MGTGTCYAVFSMIFPTQLDLLLDNLFSLKFKANGSSGWRTEPELVAAGNEGAERTMEQSFMETKFSCRILRMMVLGLKLWT